MVGVCSGDPVPLILEALKKIEAKLDAIEAKLDTIEEKLDEDEDDFIRIREDTISCGGHVAFKTDKGDIRVRTVRVTLEDNCSANDPSRSEIECRADINNPATAFNREFIADGEEGSLECAIPPVGESSSIVTDLRAIVTSKSAN